MSPAATGWRGCQVKGVRGKVGMEMEQLRQRGGLLQVPRPQRKGAEWRELACSRW